MSKQLELPILDTSTSSAEGSLVRTSQPPAEGEASQAHGRGSGRISRGSSKKSGRGSSSSKTSRCFADEALALSSPTFPRAGMTLLGNAYPLPPSAPLTVATGSSWSRGEYPTPTASRYGSGQNGTRPSGETYGTKGSPSLDTWARRATAWPTPRHEDWECAQTMASRIEAGRVEHLTTVARLWLTPTTSDAASSRRHGYMQSGHPGTTLSDAIDSHHHQTKREPGKPGAHQVELNPEFVEALMGFPPGWTEMLGSEPSGTQSSRRSRKRSGG